jgi:O-antigen ligase
MGQVAVELSQREMRWTVYALAGTVLGVLMLVGGQARLLPAYLVLGLSLNVHYYVTQPLPMLYVGNSSPTAISIPLVALPAAAIVLRRRLLAHQGGGEFWWGPEISRPAAWLCGTILVSSLLSTVRFYGVCALLEVGWMYLVFLAMLNTTRSEADARRVVNLLLLTMGLQAAIAIVQSVLGVTFTAVGQVSQGAGQTRVTGTVGTNPSGFATFMEPLVLLVWCRFRCSASRRERVVSALLAAAGTLAVLLTLNRSSWVGLVIGFVLLEYLCRRYGLGARRLNSRVLVLLGVLAFAALSVLPLLQGRKANVEVDYEIRANLMKIAVRMIAANPLLGVGPGGYGFHLGEYAAGLRTWLYIVHNDYLLILAERGLLGFLAWALWLRAGVRQARLGAQTLPMPLREVPVVLLATVGVLGWEWLWNSAQPFSSQALVWLFFGLVLAMNKLEIREGDTRRTGASAQQAPAQAVAAIA